MMYEIDDGDRDSLFINVCRNAKRKHVQERERNGLTIERREKERELDDDD